MVYCFQLSGVKVIGVVVSPQFDYYIRNDPNETLQNELIYCDQILYLFILAYEDASDAPYRFLPPMVS